MLVPEIRSGVTTEHIDRLVFEFANGLRGYARDADSRKLMAETNSVLAGLDSATIDDAVNWGDLHSRRGTHKARISVHSRGDRAVKTG
jgi:hypothetical protein